MSDSRKLVAYFSTHGATAGAARTLARAIGADVFEIKPAEPYTADDLNWRDAHARCTVEEHDQSIRPAVAETLDGMDAYDVVFVGYPIWYGHEPAVVDTFLEQCDLAGKVVVPFCTSGGSPVSDLTNRHFQEACPAGADCRPAKRLNGMDEDACSAWVEELGL